MPAMRAAQAVPRYVVAFALALAALFVARALGGFDRNPAPLTPLVLGVLASAYYGGFGPGLFTGALAIASAKAPLIAAFWRLEANDPGEDLRLVAFTICAVAISAVCERLRRSQRALQARVAQHRDSEARYRGVAEELRRSERLYRAIGESIDYGVWICDPAGANTYASESFLTLVGLTQKQCSSSGWSTVLHPDDAPATMAAWKACVEGGTDWEREHRFKGADGQWHHVLARGVPIRDDDGRIECWAGINLDITALKRTQAALAESEERLRLGLTAAGLVAFDMDLATGRVRCSPNAVQVWGMVEGDAAEFFSRVVPDDRQKVTRAAASGGEGGRPYSLEYRVVAPDGGTRWLHSLGEFKAGPDGTATRLVGMSVDITDRKAVEETLRTADRRKDEFLATLAHELRNPLAPLRTALHLLRGPGLDPQVGARAIAIMDRQVSQLVRLVDDLLDVSRITRGHIELQRQPTAAADALASAVELCRPLIDDAAHSVVLNVPSRPILLNADPTRLGQILGNLVNNAARYTPAGGTIALSVTTDDQVGVISVRDTGTGIAPEMLGRIFEPFTRATHAHGQTHGGLGIGLTLVKRLVELHGGTVSARSAGPGTGSEFVVRLPLAAAADDAAVPVPLPPDAPRPRRVLIVDDNRDSADTLDALLRSLGHDVTTVYTGPAAVDAARRLQPHVVLLDLGMPGMDGFEVAARLRAEEALQEMVVIALTGWGQAADRIRTAAAGFDHHLTKPADPEVLRRLLQSARGDALLAS